MSYDVVESASEARDLDAAVSYLVDALKNPSAAKHLLDEYESLVGALGKTPSFFPFVRDDLLRAAGYRWAQALSYLVFFTVDEENKQVRIERIAHESRNWAALLR